MADTDPRSEIPQHLQALRAFALSLTRNGAAADDMVQDTIVKAWTNFEKFTPGTNLRGWLFTILRNTYYSERRKRRREVADSDGAYASLLAEKPVHDDRLQMQEFRRAFENLPDEQREALMLVGVSGFSHEEAAEMCGVAIGTIKSRANRGRRKLASLMGLEPGRMVDLTDEPTKAVLNPGRGVDR